MAPRKRWLQSNPARRCASASADICRQHGLRRKPAARSRISLIGPCAIWDGPKRCWRRMTSKAPEPALLHGFALLRAGADLGPRRAGGRCAIQCVHGSRSSGDGRPRRTCRSRMPKAWSTRCCGASCANAKALLQQVLRNPVAQWNYPAWWIDAIKSTYPGELASHSRCRQCAAAADLARELPQDHSRRLVCIRCPNKVSQPRKSARLRCVWHRQCRSTGFPDSNRRQVSVQDAAAQLAAPLLDLQAGMRVLDACAAPAARPAIYSNARMSIAAALDSDSRRLPRIDEICKDCNSMQN